MTSTRRMVPTALSLLVLSSIAAHAASRTSWEGTWSGAWGGSEPTSITIAGKRVVSYEYQSVSHPVNSSNVTPEKITYEDNGVIVTLTKTGETTAHATLHSEQGDATAELKRQ